MRVLVTGGTGFLGRHVVWRLGELGHDVVFTGRNDNAAALVRKLAPAVVQFERLEHGCPDAASVLVRLAAGIDAIVHCAALSSPWGKRDDFESANVVGTREVIAACRQHRIPRLIHISTPGVYFDYRDRLDIRETDPLPKPVNRYVQTKRRAEKLVAAEANDISAVILRPRALFGPWDNTLLPRFLRVLKHGAVPILRGGKALIDVTYIDNAVDAVCLALAAPLVPGVRVYNVSNGSPIPVRDLIANVAGAFRLSMRTRKFPYWVAKIVGYLCELGAFNGAEPRLTRYSVGLLAFSQTLSLEAIRRDLGYEPKVSVAEGIARYANWWHVQQASAPC